MESTPPHQPWSDEWDEELHAIGNQAGRDWVERGAFPQKRRGELRRLRKYYESHEAEQWHELWLDADSPPDETDIMFQIDPGSEQDPQAAAEHWEQIIGLRNDSDVEETEFILGFVEGTLELEPSPQIDVKADAKVDEEPARMPSAIRCQPRQSPSHDHPKWRNMASNTVGSRCPRKAILRMRPSNSGLTRYMPGTLGMMTDTRHATRLKAKVVWVDLRTGYSTDTAGCALSS